MEKQCDSEIEKGRESAAKRDNEWNKYVWLEKVRACVCERVHEENSH